jgi:hypothetical protein
VLTSHWKEVAVAAATLNEAFAPAQIVWFSGCVVIEGPAPGFIIYVTVIIWVEAPDAVPVTVILYVPGDNVFPLFNLTVTLLPGVTVLDGTKLIKVPVGAPEAVKVIGLENPPLETVPKTTSIDAGAGHVVVAGAGVLKENPLGGAIVAVHIPRPWVPAAIVLSEARYRIISVLTVGKVVFGTQIVEEPFN